MNIIRATNLKASVCAITEVLGTILNCDIEEVKLHISTSKGDKYTVFTKRVTTESNHNIYAGGVIDLNGKR